MLLSCRPLCSCFICQLRTVLASEGVLCLAGAQVVVSTFYMACAACLAEYLSGCLILPTLARHELQTTTALVIRVRCCPTRLACSAGACAC